MEQEKIDFLLRYAKDGVLSKKKILDDIEYKEEVETYLAIKRELTAKPKSDPAPGTSSPKKGSDDDGAFKKWLGGIGARQKAYKEKHKDELA